MGAEPGDIEQQIEEQRRRTGPKLTELRGRLLHDIEEAQVAAKRQASRISKRTLQIIGAVTGAFVIGAIVAIVIGRQRRKRELRRRPEQWWKQFQRMMQDRSKDWQGRVQDASGDWQKRFQEWQKELQKMSKEASKQASKEMAKKR
ncbi:MAG: hypothetical protein WD533_00455 [Dehalococcoidia bacterium]